MKIQNGMIVKVVYLPPLMKHFGHLNEIGKVTRCKYSQFFIQFEEDCTGWWKEENVEIIDLNKEERIENLTKIIKTLSKKIEEIKKEE